MRKPNKCQQQKAYQNNGGGERARCPWVARGQLKESVLDVCQGQPGVRTEGRSLAANPFASGTTLPASKLMPLFAAVSSELNVPGGKEEGEGDPEKQTNLQERGDYTGLLPRAWRP